MFRLGRARGTLSDQRDLEIIDERNSARRFAEPRIGCVVSVGRDVRVVFLRRSVSRPVVGRQPAALLRLPAGPASFSTNWKASR